MAESVQSIGLKPTCPGSFSNCSNINGRHGMEMPSNVAYVSIVSSLVSCIGSILIIFSYAR